MHGQSTSSNPRKEIRMVLSDQKQQHCFPKHYKKNASIENQEQPRAVFCGKSKLLVFGSSRSLPEVMKYLDLASGFSTTFFDHGVFTEKKIKKRKYSAKKSFQNYFSKN